MDNDYFDEDLVEEDLAFQDYVQGESLPKWVGWVCIIVIAGMIAVTIWA